MTTTGNWFPADQPFISTWIAPICRSTVMAGSAWLTPSRRINSINAKLVLPEKRRKKYPNRKFLRLQFFPGKLNNVPIAADPRHCSIRSVWSREAVGSISLFRLNIQTASKIADLTFAGHQKDIQSPQTPSRTVSGAYAPFCGRQGSPHQQQRPSGRRRRRESSLVKIVING